MRPVIGLCAVVLLSVSACGGGSKPAAKVTPSPSPSVSIPGMTHPTAAQQAAFIREVRWVSAGLVASRNRAVSRGRNVCLDLAESEKLAVSHLRAAETELSREDAAKVVAAAKRNFCP